MTKNPGPSLMNEADRIANAIGEATPLQQGGWGITGRLPALPRRVREPAKR